MPWLQEGHLERIAKALQGPTIVRKGPQDHISNGSITIICDEQGSPRRAGGQVRLFLASMLLPFHAES
jgi:ATP-dependent NAD(P)H-hydrate dehydratase